MVIVDVSKRYLFFGTFFCIHLHEYPAQVIPTDKNPVQLWYVPSLDQVWILNWRNEKDVGMKTVQVIEGASQKKKHRAIRPEPIDAQFDVIQNIFIPEPQVIPSIVDCC